MLPRREPGRILHPSTLKGSTMDRKLRILSLTVRCAADQHSEWIFHLIDRAALRLWTAPEWLGEGA